MSLDANWKRGAGLTPFKWDVPLTDMGLERDERRLGMKRDRMMTATIRII